MKTCTTCGHEQRIVRDSTMCIYTKDGRSFDLTIPFTDTTVLDEFRCLILFEGGITILGTRITAKEIDDIVLDFKEEWEV